jgi:vitamin-K-epoxide reductase (warfarin-sensitive)
MRWWIVTLAALGVLVAGMAWHEHLNTGTSPCSINERWDCGVVNHSPYAVIASLPVAAIGVFGYVFLLALALRRAWRALLAFAVAGLVFSLYLAYVEAYKLEVWCLLCVFSLALISLITISAVVQMIFALRASERSPAQ